MITTSEKINEQGVWVMTFFLDGKEIGHMYGTYHPIISYEVYNNPVTDSKRVFNKEEAIEWLTTNK
jgi:hypothetical protein